MPTYQIAPETILETPAKGLAETPAKALNAVVGPPPNLFGASVRSENGLPDFINPIYPWPSPSARATEAQIALQGRYGIHYPIIFEFLLGNGSISNQAELASIQTSLGIGYSSSYTYKDGSPAPNLAYVGYRLIDRKLASWTIKRGLGYLIESGAGVFYDLPDTPEVMITGLTAFGVNNMLGYSNVDVTPFPNEYPVVGTYFGVYSACGEVNVTQYPIANGPSSFGAVIPVDTGQIVSPIVFQAFEDLAVIWNLNQTWPNIAIGPAQTFFVS